MYYDIARERIIGDHSEEVARMYAAQINSAEECVEEISSRIQKLDVPFNLIRLGDIEARFLLWHAITDPTVRKLIEKNIWWCGIDKNRIPSSTEFVAALRGCDYLGIHDPRVNPVPFWGVSLDALSRYHIMGFRKFYEVHAIYKYAGSGRFFQDQWGRDVVVVGGKATLYEQYFHRSSEFQKMHPELGLEKINLLDVVPTPDFPDFAMNYLEQIWGRINNANYPEGTIYWLSCGFLAKILAHRIKVWLGSTALDIGNVLETMMNLSAKRPFMDRFYDRPHPLYDFKLSASGLTVETVTRRTDV